MFWMQDILQLTEEDRILHKTSLSFDVSVWEWSLPLIEGSCLVIATLDGHRDPVYLNRIIQEQSVSVLNFVPTMLSSFIDAAVPEACLSIRHILTSGEALGIPLQESVFEALPQTTLWNVYGPSETSDDVTYWRCQPEDKNVTPPIGSPIWNTQLYLSLIHI